MSTGPGATAPSDSLGMGRTLAEHESLALLREYGIPAVDEAVVDTAAHAATAAAAVSFPVVVKLTGPTITHKTERGLVRLALQTETEVHDAARDLLAAARPEDGTVALVVAPMVRGIRELITGIHSDPQFGPVVMVGIGGVWAEAVADVAVRLAPLEGPDGLEMLDDLRTQALLGPFRGEPAVDRDAVAAVLTALCTLSADHPEVTSVDVNPLVIVDGAPIAVDALVELDS
jgi:acetate---CoA ligase (ADP-forming) subunit beta